MNERFSQRQNLRLTRLVKVSRLVALLKSVALNVNFEH